MISAEDASNLVGFFQQGALSGYASTAARDVRGWWTLSIFRPKLPKAFDRDGQVGESFVGSGVSVAAAIDDLRGKQEPPRAN